MCPHCLDTAFILHSCVMWRSTWVQIWCLIKPATTVNPCLFQSLAMFEEVVCAAVSQLGRPETKCEVAQHMPAKVSQAPSPSDRVLSATRCKLSHAHTTLVLPDMHTHTVVHMCTHAMTCEQCEKHKSEQTLLHTPKQNIQQIRWSQHLLWSAD